MHFSSSFKTTKDQKVTQMVFKEEGVHGHNISRIPRTDTSQSFHDCLGNSDNVDSTQISQKIRISSAIKRLKAKDTIPTDTEALPDQSCIKEVINKDGRPLSANFVLQYADVPIQIADHPLGRPTRGTVLRNLRRNQSASSVCSDFSWITDNRRLCNIRDYYRLCKSNKITHDPENGESLHAFLTGARFNSAHWLDSLTLSKGGLYINKEDLSNVFQVPNPPYAMFEKSKTIANRRKDNNDDFLKITGKGLKTYKNVAVNTEKNHLSINTWHGAEWQKELPKMYGKKPDKYNPNISVPMRSKRMNSQYRDPVKMSMITARRTKSAI